MPSDVGMVAGAVTQVLKFVDTTFINPSERRLLTQEEKEQLSDENQFKENLLAGDADNCLLFINSCVCTTPPELTSSESAQLRQTTLHIDANTVLRLGCCAKEADRLRKQLQIALTTKS